MRPIRPTWETISPQITTSGKSYTRATGLRALWTVWSVEVRVLSGALGSASESPVQRALRCLRSCREAHALSPQSPFVGRWRRSIDVDHRLLTAGPTATCRSALPERIGSDGPASRLEHPVRLLRGPCASRRSLRARWHGNRGRLAVRAPTAAARRCGAATFLLLGGLATARVRVRAATGRSRSRVGGQLSHRESSVSASGMT